MVEKKQVVIVEDDTELRESLEELFAIEGFEVTGFSSAHGVVESLTDDFPGVVVTDIRMEGETGVEMMKRLLHRDAGIPVVIISGHADIAIALDAMKNGAFEFVEKPADPAHLVAVVHTAVRHRELVLENRKLRETSHSRGVLDSRLIGRSESMLQLKRTLINIADTDVNIMINGETGSGKEMVARCLHDFSRKKAGPFVAINCGAIPENLIESELFGHEAGAFTGASKKRIGKIEYASGGTLFLDEIESMPMHLQIRLLRVLQEQEFERVGSNEVIKVDLRVVSAAKGDLLAQAESGDFRKDLYYRLNVAYVDIPPLRERTEDIPQLLSQFVDAAATRLQRPTPTITADTLSALMAYPWPGNVRELMNEADRLVLNISPFTELDTSGADTTSLPDQLARIEKNLLDQMLRQHDGHVSDTADALGIPRKNLYLRMKKFNLRKEDYL